MAKTHSVSVRVRRTTVEYAYVLIPVTDAVMQTDETGAVARDQEGHAHLDPEKVCDQATALAQSPAVRWFREDERVEVHPIQKAPDPGEETC